MEQCTNFPRTSAEEANKAPVSVGPDWGGYCEIFGKTGCEEKIRNVEFPGECVHVEPFQSIRCLKGSVRGG